MRFQNLLFIIIVILSIISLACPGETPPDSNEASSQAANSDSPADTKVKTKDPLGTDKTPEPTKEVKVADTLNPVVTAYCAAINSGDDAALKKVFTQAAWRSLSNDARSEGKNSVAKYLAASEPIGDTCRVINERIVGSTAEAIVITKSYPNGVGLKFILENGSWKWTNQSSDFEQVNKGSGK